MLLWSLLVSIICSCKYDASAQESNVATHSAKHTKPLLVIGSLNVDITIEVERLPEKDETITARSPATQIAVGGKGANQAVAAARIAFGSGRRVHFICQLGNDAHAAWLESVLQENGVDVSRCTRSKSLPSGQGLVLLGSDGSASSVVVGGSNIDWPETLPQAYLDLLQDAGAVLLQREIPEKVNEAVALAANALDVPVIQDVGGEDRPISDDLLRRLAFLCPNESELQRLTGMSTASEDEVLAAAKQLQARGARNVLVTLGSRGALLLEESGNVLRQDGQLVPGGRVLDATAAGDAFRAAFAVALLEGLPLQESLRLGAAAGAVAVSKRGAVPSLPWRQDCEALLHGSAEKPQGHCVDRLCQKTDAMSNVGGIVEDSNGVHRFPKQFASRLNSMKARPDLWEGSLNTLGLVARQGKVHGLDLVYFNYPQHLENLDLLSVKNALEQAGLKAGGVAMRYPENMRMGAFTGPDRELQKESIAMTVRGCQWAKDLGSDELVVWPQTDGYDYQFQVDYTAAWDRAVHAFREVIDAASCDGIKISLEFKPTDEISRFAIIPSTGAALLFVQQVDRANLGLTLDVGHLLMAGENPAQSVAMVGNAGKLFGVHLNDGHSRLGAEDGLMFGSVHPLAALELVYWLRKTKYQGHIYFDTFPGNEDPVREAEFNIRRFQLLWNRSTELGDSQLEGYLERHDAQGSLELLERLRML